MSVCGQLALILGVYGPTDDRPMDEKEQFMETLQEQIENINHDQQFILAGDLNGIKG